MACAGSSPVMLAWGRSRFESCRQFPKGFRGIRVGGVQMDDNWILRAAAVDVRYWRLLHADSCPNCRVEWKIFPAESNIVPHFNGDCKKFIEQVRQAEDEKFLKAIGISSE